MTLIGRALRVNLDTVSTSVFDIPAPMRELYLGGRGLTTGLMYHFVPPDTGVRSPNNPVLIAPGVLAGTPSFATGGFVVTSRSPLTGNLIHSWAVGDWGAALKRAGFDALWITGQASAWLYLVINNGQAEFYPADQLNGLDTRQINEQLQREHGADARVLTLGTAGEKILPLAALVAEGRYMAEPAGTGAVMAHKRLKAVVVRGTRMIKPADSKAVVAIQKQISERTKQEPLAHHLRQRGSRAYLPQIHKHGGISRHNGQESWNPDALEPYLFDSIAKNDHGCPRCPMPCYHDEAASNRAMPEIESVIGFGARCGMTSPDALIEAHDRCVRYGLDPTATAQAIAFLIECRQRELTRQYQIEWGDEATILATIDAIASKDGIGGLLSLGVAEMSDVFYGSATFAPAVNKLAMSPIDPRAAHGWALHVATNPIGGDARGAMPWYEWLESIPTWLKSTESHAPNVVEGKAERLIWHERFVALLDSLGLCRRLGTLGYQVSLKEVTDLLSADLGKPITPLEIAKLGERIITVERLLALQWHHRDALPPRWLNEPLSQPTSAQSPILDLDILLAKYYARHGWDADGIPTAQRLTELGIPDPDSRPWVTE